MSHYRKVYQCKNCGKVYRSEYRLNLNAGNLRDLVCGRCGSYDVKSVIARPVWFGLKGWDVGAKDMTIINKKMEPKAEVVNEHNA